MSFDLGGEDTGGDLRAQQAAVIEVAVARDNEVQLVGDQEELKQDTVEVSRDLSVPMAAKGRDGSLSRNSLQLDTVQADDATGQDVMGEVLGGQDFLQTGGQPNLDVTPEQQLSPRHVRLAPGAPSPVLPDAFVTSHQDPVGEEALPQEQNLSHGGALQQPGEEAHISEFSLLVSFLLVFDDCN